MTFVFVVRSCIRYLFIQNTYQTYVNTIEQQIVYTQTRDGLGNLIDYRAYTISMLKYSSAKQTSATCQNAEKPQRNI